MSIINLIDFLYYKYSFLPKFEKLLDKVIDGKKMSKKEIRQTQVLAAMDNEYFTDLWFQVKGYKRSL